MTKRSRDIVTEPVEKEMLLLSMPDIIRMAAAKFIDSSSTEASDIHSTRSSNDDADVELVHHLLRAADEVDHKRYEEATRLLDLCDALSSKEGNLAQRVTHYFVQALREKVRNETEPTHPVSDLMNRNGRVVNFEETVMYEKIPFFKLGQQAGVQAIVETVERSKRVHIIDLRIIGNGMQWTALMQALSSFTATRRRSPPEILKITAIVTVSDNYLVRETGERLAWFAESMEIPFQFNAIVVSSLTEINEKQFDIDPRETVAVFSEYALQGLIPDPNQLEALMSVFRRIQPDIMVVIETEANLNSSRFGHRFVEVLFHYGAYFDCADACLESGDRGLVESMFLSDIVRERLVKEGKEMARVVTVDVWRKFFGRFWMWEMGLSSSAMDTVNLLLGRSVGGKSCTLDMNGGSLVVGWKGTPIFSVSTWKFLHFRTTPTTDSFKALEVR